MRNDLKQNILLKTADSYLMLLATIEIHKLSKSNLKVLRRYYESTKSRFDVGEATTTDLALSKAKFLSGQSDEIKARGDIEIEKSKFYSIVGEEASNKLKFPDTEIKVPEKLKFLLRDTLKENPKIIEYGLKKKSAFSDISLSASKLLPQLDLNFTAQNAWAPNTFFEEYENYKVELSLNIPLYSGGYNYSDVRQKKEIQNETLGLDFINDIRPVTFKHKSPSEFPKEWNAYNADDKEPMGGDKRIHGLIAQEVKQALDNQGIDTFGGWGEEDDGRQHISFESFVLPLIKSVQELSSENKQLKDKLNDLEIFIMDKLGDK